MNLRDDIAQVFNVPAALRAARGLWPHDGTGTLTDTESVYNTLGGLERQQQRVMRAHPSQPSMTDSGSVVSEFDESGRRFGRRNPGDVSWTRWDFDRKHRPTDAYLVYGGTWTGAFHLSEYKYLGGGLLHSEHIKHMTQATSSFGTKDRQRNNPSGFR